MGMDDMGFAVIWVWFYNEYILQEVLRYGWTTVRRSVQLLNHLCRYLRWYVTYHRRSCHRYLIHWSLIYREIGSHQFCNLPLPHQDDICI